METFRLELHNELVNNILPYWIKNMVDGENGGFYGRIDGNERLHKHANKSIVLNARILWTFSAAYRLEKNSQYLEIAKRAYQYILDYFTDKEYGGVYWEVDSKGNPVNLRKQTYAQGFALYGYSEFYRATGKPEALEISIALFRLIEKQAHDPVYGGYLEAFQRDWQAIGDMRLSEKDANEAKSMNTHLHILEPYTNLLRVWKDPDLIKAQKELIQIFCHHIIHPETHHLNLFFNEQWEVKSSLVSYGHDIEAVWLLYEAAETLNDEILLKRIKPLVIQLIEAAYEGIREDGSLIYEAERMHVDADRHWWVQAEAVAGSVYAYQITGNPKYLDTAKKCWEYIKQYIRDEENGEWVWSVFPDGKQNRTDDKAGAWKCPYHNARMCMNGSYEL
ncbi:MAG: AGE family epimerase/isomerase [Dysgonamonadaceae bacterium]|jgi:mannobiose 2-epimerase|nr:AGE family epimerase/isomerase [Dysgonamonadaceae bacterium]